MTTPIGPVRAARPADFRWWQTVAVLFFLQVLVLIVIAPAMVVTGAESGHRVPMLVQVVADFGLGALALIVAICVAAGRLKARWVAAPRG